MSDADYAEDLPQAKRIARVSELVLQAPPGEINEVVNDAKLILNDQAVLDQVLRKVLPSYHREHNTVVDLPGQSHKAILATVAQIPSLSEDEPVRYFDPRSGQSFRVDHVSLTASEVEPLELSSKTAFYLASFAKPLDAYVANHFTFGDGGIFPHLKLGTPQPQSVTEEAAPVSVTAPVTDVESGESDVPKAGATETLRSPESADADADAPIQEDSKLDAGVSKEFAVPSSEVEDKAIATALVETAEEIAAVAKEVEAEQMPAEEGGDMTEPTSDGTVAATGLQRPSAPLAGDDLTAKSKVALTESSDPQNGLIETQPASATAEEARPMEGLEEATVTLKGAFDVTASVVSEATVSTSAPAAAPVEVDEGKYTLVLSGHRYSPNNFWSGSWRSHYAIDLASDSVHGRIEAVVHYYEQGNVHMHTADTPSFLLPPAGEKQPQMIIDEISRLERAAQESINERLEQLGDKAFRSLRRALPVTRQKVEWEKISGYRLGGAIGGKSRPEEEAAL